MPYEGDAWDNDEFRFFFELTLVPVIVGNMTNFTVEAEKPSQQEYTSSVSLVLKVMIQQTAR